MIIKRIIKISWLFLLILSSCRTSSEDPMKAKELKGYWQSSVVKGSEIGDLVYKCKFLNDSKYEISFTPIDEPEGSFVAWGSYSRIKANTFKLNLEFIGGTMNGKIVEKDKYDSAIEGDNDEIITIFEVNNVDYIKLTSKSKPADSIVFERVIKQPTPQKK